jgi:hypothetical protein
MAQARDVKGPSPGRGAPSSPNIQDVFLNHVRREKAVVTIRLMDGGFL